jgi:LytS/YehU family sensor histidine kinase
MRNSRLHRFLRLTLSTTWALIFLPLTGDLLTAQATMPGAQAQSIAPSLITLSANRAGVVKMDRADPFIPNSPPIAEVQQGGSGHLWLYLLGGIVVGGAVGGIAMGVHAASCSKRDDCAFAGPAVAVAAVGGALLGGLIGLVAYADAGESRTQPATVK